MSAPIQSSSIDTATLFRRRQRGIVLHGLASTLGVTLEMMIMHGQACVVAWSRRKWSSTRRSVPFEETRSRLSVMPDKALPVRPRRHHRTRTTYANQ
ncbi:hypothetical protein [Mesorhizobium sp. M1027]|uniref:hypothetical protein n=1 Tax=Mesorhizobium sp. M1027 TaxID=2957050 RepID=UPI003335960F